jgi:hypothetical protein
MSARLMLTQHLHCCWTARRGHDLTYGGWGRDGVCAATLLSGKGYMSMVFPMTQCMQHTPLTQVYLRLAEQWLCVVTATAALARCAYIPYNGPACNGIWDIAGAVGNLVSCHHPCGTVNPRRAPTPGFGCHTGCPMITQACTCTTYRALPASRQSSIVPVHKGGAPLPRARGPGCEPGTSRL